MPDIGGLEFLVIAVVALIVLGPKDLTKLFRSLGQFTGRMRGMAKEFSRAMNDAAGETGMKDISRDLRDMTNPKKMGLDAVNKAFEGVDPTKYPEGSETRKLAEQRAEEYKTGAKERAAEYARQQREKKAAAAAAEAEGEPAPESAPDPVPEQTPRPTAGETS